MIYMYVSSFPIAGYNTASRKDSARKGLKARLSGVASAFFPGRNRPVIRNHEGRGFRVLPLRRSSSSEARLRLELYGAETRNVRNSQTSLHNEEHLWKVLVSSGLA